MSCSQALNFVCPWTIFEFPEKETMRFPNFVFTGLVSILTLCSMMPAQAGPYTDDLSKCLIGATTQNDRTALVKWMFAAAASHPAVKSIASVSKEQLDAAHKSTAELITKLLTESCREEAQKALKYEGLTTLQSSFQVLGQVAGQELFASPEVGAQLSAFEKYLDGEKLAGLLKGN